MRFGIDLNVVEIMATAGAGIALSYYLRPEQDESGMNTDDVVRVLAGVGSYVIGKGLYTLAKGIREHSGLNNAELPEMTQQTPPPRRYHGS